MRKLGIAFLVLSEKEMKWDREMDGFVINEVSDLRDYFTCQSRKVKREELRV